jgi:hypothetical protein
MVHRRVWFDTFVTTVVVRSDCVENAALNGLHV